MKSVEFSKEMLQDKEALAAALFYDEKDPSSPTYKRVLERPEINWLKICSFIFLPMLFSVGLFFILKLTGLKTWTVISICILTLVIYVLIIAKRAALCAVRIYQRYAPAAVRNKCRFEPSCSQYMALAITKYGLVKGVFKGIGRLRRCNGDHGGFDYP